MSNRLSSLSASLSLSNIVEDKSNEFNIHSSPTHDRDSISTNTKNEPLNDKNTHLSPNSRTASKLKMQSYFDKENVWQRHKSSQKLRSPPQTQKECRNPLSPLKQTSTNIQNKRQSLASVKTSSTDKTSKASSDNRRSFVSYNSNESTRSLYRKSLDTFGLKRSGKTEHVDHVESDVPKETLDDAKNFDAIDKVSAPNSSEESGFSKLKKTITKSSSFISLKNSLSMKSLSSNLDSESFNNNDKRKSMMSRRKMSLENIRSFIMPTKNDNYEFKNNISLPIMQQQTKDKIRHKLRHSSSIVSISSFTSETERAKLKAVDLNQMHQSLLLKLCNQSRIVSFTSYINKFQSSSTMKHLTKLHNSKNSCIFVEFSSTDDFSNVTLKPSGVWKVIPIDADTISKAIQELTLTMLMSNKPGFVTINSAKVVKGPCPQSILELMEEEQHKNQVYLIMRLNYGGISLKDYKVKSWKDASIIFTQLLNAMCDGEEENYEHRDLNIDNIMIAETTLPNKSTAINVTIIDHALGYGVVGGQSIYTNLYHSEFFKGSGEYSHTIYKLMRRVVSNHTTDLPDSLSTMSMNTLKTTCTQRTDHKQNEWARRYPIFNLLWLHYLLHVLLFEKGLKPIKMNPILKKNGWLANGGEVGEENAIYEKLLQGYRMVQPAVIFGNKKVKYLREVQNVSEFRDWYNQ